MAGVRERCAVCSPLPTAAGQLAVKSSGFTPLLTVRPHRLPFLPLLRRRT